MKKNLLFLSIGIIMLLFTFPACEKDKVNPLSEIILGKWEVQTEVHNSYDNNVLNEDTTINFEDDEMVVEFIKGGDGKIYEYDELMGWFTWELNNSNLTMNITLDVIEFKASYTESTKKMVLTMSETWTEDSHTYKYEMLLTILKL